MNKKSKSVEVIEEDGKTIIYVYPRFLKAERPTKSNPSVIILEGDKVYIKLDLDLNINLNEEDESLGINLQSEKNFSINGEWYTKKQFITGFSNKVDKFVDEEDDDEFEYEYVVNISGVSESWGIRTKNEQAQQELINILLKWYYNE